MVRTIARPLLAGIFIAGGLNALQNPGPRAEQAKPVVERMASAVRLLPRDPVTAVQLNAALHVGAGGLLAAGVLPRLAALALATSIVPTTLAGHRFWEVQDAAQRAQQQSHFLKNAAILGGLLLTALD